MTEYLLTYQREGFENLNSFLQILRDDWVMQANLSNTITERYPKNLSTHHDVLSLKQRFVSTEVDKKKFAEYYSKQKDMAWSDDRYIVVVPQTVNDMVDEAIQQNNCLRTYISRVLEGQTSIFFLRRKKTPDESLVTIEVNKGAVVQAKARFNRSPGRDELAAIKKWSAAKGIIA